MDWKTNLTPGELSLKLYKDPKINKWKNSKCRLKTIEDFKWKEKWNKCNLDFKMKGDNCNFNWKE